MKKFLAILTVLALVAPAMSATVTIADTGSLTGTITVTSEGDPLVGLGLDIDVSGGAVTALSISPATFNIYPDTAQIQVAGDGYAYGEYGDNGPIAEQLAAGDKALPSSSFAVSAGMLNGEEIAGADGSASVVITITVDASCTVCVKENDLRGGIVVTTGGDGEDITNGDEGVVCGDIGGTTPTCRDQFTGDMLALYDRYVTAGNEPLAWCWQYQCRGDADNATEDLLFTGTLRIYNNDLNAVIVNWKLTPATGADPCADIDHAEEALLFTGNLSVYNNDLNRIVVNWKKTTGSLPDCPSY